MEANAHNVLNIINLTKGKSKLISI